MNPMTTLQTSELGRSDRPDDCFLRRRIGKAFTLIELMIVIVVIGIAAAMAIPMMSSATSFQIRAAANVIAGDLEYAKSMAISHGQPYSVVFDIDNESYEILQNGNAVTNPITKDASYVVNFGTNSRVDRVDISDADFDGATSVTFDYLGSPWSDSSPLNSGTITLIAGDDSKQVTVEAVTGYISISDLSD